VSPVARRVATHLRAAKDLMDRSGTWFSLTEPREMRSSVG
jgi:hypothetical protein